MQASQSLSTQPSRLRCYTIGCSSNDDDSIAEADHVWLNTDFISDIKYGLNESAQLSMEELARRRTYELTEHQWSLVEHILPDTETTDHHGRRNTPNRNVVNALIFKMTTKIPIGRLPAYFGKRKPIYNAILRFAYAGGIERLRSKLHRYYPDLVEAWDFESVSKLTRAEKVAAVPRVIERPAVVAERRVASGDYHLTEKQWLALKPAIHETVCHPTGRKPCQIAERTLLELILLKLHTRCAWRKVPIGPIAYEEFLGAFMRMAYSGSWDNVAAILRRDFPGVLDGIDTGPMESQKRSVRVESVGAEGVVRKAEDTLALRIWDGCGAPRKATAEDWADLSEREWSIVSEVLPPLSRKRHRAAVDATLFVMATRTAWQQLPGRYGSRSTIYKVFRRFAKQEADGSSVIGSIVVALEQNSPKTLERMGRSSKSADTPAPAPILSERFGTSSEEEGASSTETKPKTSISKRATTRAVQADRDPAPTTITNQLDLFG